MKYNLPIVNNIISMELEHEILSASQHVEDKNFNSIVSVG